MALGSLSFLTIRFLYSRQGYAAPTAIKLLKPATKLSIAEQMAANLARSNIGLRTDEAQENASFWNAVRRQVAAIQKVQRRRQKHVRPSM